MLLIFAGLQLSAALLTPSIVPSPVCVTATNLSFYSKAELSSGALEAFAAPIADIGQPFQSGDIVTDPQLPIYRFVSAEQRGCTISIVYQYGGQGSGTTAVSLIGEGSRWRLIDNLVYHDQAKSNLPTATDDPYDVEYYALGITGALGTIEAYREMCAVPDSYQMPEVATAQVRAKTLYAAAHYAPSNVMVNIENSKRQALAEHHDHPDLIPCWAFHNQVKVLHEWSSVTDRNKTR